MATEIGTATNYLDLLEKLRLFLTTNATLVSAGQQWTVLKDSTEGVDRTLYFRAPGLAGTDQIFTVIEAYKSVGSDYYNWGLYGTSGHLPSNAYNLQPGTSAPVYLPLWNSSIPYWFIANGRRCIVIAKVSTTYQSMYMGFITPHASPTEYPYPLFVGATHHDRAKRWSNTDSQYKAFWNPASDGSALATAWLREVGGDWQMFGNYASNSGDAVDSSAGDYIWPYTTEFEDQKQLFGGPIDYLLLPLVLHTNNDNGNVYGELDGVFFISGFGNASENTHLISGTNYLVVQNTFRTSREHYCAVKLS